MLTKDLNYTVKIYGTDENNKQELLTTFYLRNVLSQDRILEMYNILGKENFETILKVVSIYTLYLYVKNIEENKNNQNLEDIFAYLLFEDIYQNISEIKGNQEELDKILEVYQDDINNIKEDLEIIIDEE